MADDNKQNDIDEPYFAKEAPAGALPSSSTGPNVMFVDFLNRLSGPARVKIDKHQEMLIMALRSRCLKYAFSAEDEAVIAALDQLCAFYHQCAIKAGLKVFEVFAKQNEEYIKVQEQFFYSERNSRQHAKRPVEQTNNLLVRAHDLYEGLLRRLAALGMFSIDVIRGRDRARDLSPTQYVDIDLRTKERTFSEDVSILASTHEFLFGAVHHEIRNAIAHKRYEIQEDGSVVLYDFAPGKKARKQVGELSQQDLKTLILSLERAVDVFEISLLIFQHNNGTLLNQLGHYGAKKNLTGKKMREMIYLNAAACFMRIDGIAIRDDIVTIDASFLSFESTPSEGKVFVSSKDQNGEPFQYELTVPERELSARDQTLRLLQVASLYCHGYRAITIRTKDILGRKPLGEVSVSLDLLLRWRDSRISKEELLKQLPINTFTSSKEVS